MNRDRDTASESGSTSKVSAASHSMTLLSGFTPGIDDVICGRGKKCYSHIGNERFRQRVIKMLSAYSQAKTKMDKSNVLSSVVEQVRAASKDGGFVKQDGDDGQWYEVGDFLAREKTSQAFRDALHEQYKSSTVAKKRRRQREQAKASDKLKTPAKNFERSKRLESLAAKGGHSESDEGLNDMLNRSSSDIMTRINFLSHSRMREDTSSPAPFSVAHSHSESHLSDETTNVPPFTFGTPTVGPPLGVGGYASLPKSRSAPASPPHRTFEEPSEMDELHHSLPNLAYTHDLLPVHEGSMAPPSLHQSVPNLNYQHRPAHAAATTAAGPLDLEPIPFDYYSPHNRKGSIKKSVMIANAAAAAAGASGDQDQKPSSGKSDLLNCLAKLTETTLGDDQDDNPFEPNPLTSASLHSEMSVDVADFNTNDDSDTTSVFEED